MQSIVHAGMVFLEILFFVGWVGSLVVVVISGVEDLETIFQKDVAAPAAAIGGDHDLK
jgi:hypothetical protein